MFKRMIVPAISIATAIAFSPFALAQSVPQRTPAKVKAVAAMPDFTGVWQGEGSPEHRYTFSKEAPPMQPWAEQLFTYNRFSADPNFRGRDELDPMKNCMPPGPTRLLFSPYPFEIFQVPGRVLIRYEWDHWLREIWTDGSAHPKDLAPTWMGHSIGKWDGDTLVVDTVGLNDKTWLDEAGHVHSDAMHIVERWRRVDHETIRINLTFDDPKAYTQTWTGEKTIKLHPNWHVAEDVVCEDRLRSPNLSP